MSEERIDREVEETIGLLGRINRAEADPYLFNKVMGKIEDAKSRGKHASAKTKFGYAFITMLIILNLITSAYIYSETESAGEHSTYQEFAQEFNLDNNANLYTGL